eukprot:gb/GEZN01002082.1/.p1 GENE.gb/GEZN01002082.1/~~gb/GEZN01002082.1/.p1  ORF type:complete len:842 (+),score=133.27 gb/GEZN01002082.1/:32-2527(+)
MVLSVVIFWYADQSDAASSGHAPRTVQLFEKTLTGETMGDGLKRSISSRVGIEPEQMVVFHKGKIIASAMSLATAGVRDGDWLVVLRRVAKPQKPERKSREDHVAEHPVLSSLSAESLMPYLSPERMQPLLEMGFSQFRSQKALLLNMFNTEQALDWLINHSEDEDIDQPLSAVQLLHIANAMNMLRPEPSVDVKAAIKDGRCTFMVTGRNFCPQEYYRCQDCNLIDTKGCCVSCAHICHNGHTLLGPVPSSSFFCDCGDGNSCLPQPCQAMIKKEEEQATKKECTKKAETSRPKLVYRREDPTKDHATPLIPADLDFNQPLGLREGQPLVHFLDYDLRLFVQSLRAPSSPPFPTSSHVPLSSAPSSSSSPPVSLSLATTAVSSSTTTSTTTSTISSSYCNPYLWHWAHACDDDKSRGHSPSERLASFLVLLDSSVGKEMLPTPVETLLPTALWCLHVVLQASRATELPNLSSPDISSMSVEPTSFSQTTSSPDPFHVTVEPVSFSHTTSSTAFVRRKDSTSSLESMSDQDELSDLSSPAIRSERLSSSMEDVAEDSTSKESPVFTAMEAACVQVLSALSLVVLFPTARQYLRQKCPDLVILCCSLVRRSPCPAVAASFLVFAVNYCSSAGIGVSSAEFSQELEKLLNEIAWLRTVVELPPSVRQDHLMFLSNISVFLARTTEQPMAPVAAQTTASLLQDLAGGILEMSGVKSVVSAVVRHLLQLVVEEHELGLICLAHQALVVLATMLVEPLPPADRSKSLIRNSHALPEAVRRSLASAGALAELEVLCAIGEGELVDNGISAPGAPAAELKALSKSARFLLKQITYPVF